MTNTAIMTGTIENITRFREFQFVIDRDGSQKALLHVNQLNDCGFTTQQLTEKSEFVVETAPGENGPRVVHVISIDGVKGRGRAKLTTAPAKTKPTARFNQKRSATPALKKTEPAAVSKLSVNSFFKISEPIDCCEKTGVKLHQVINKYDQVAQYVYLLHGVPLRSTGQITETCARVFLKNFAQKLLQAA